MSTEIESSASGEEKVATLFVNIDERLKDAIGDAADSEDIPMNEWIAKTLARVLKRPELAKVPRKRVGRPRNKASA